MRAALRRIALPHAAFLEAKDEMPHRIHPEALAGHRNLPPNAGSVTCATEPLVPVSGSGAG